MDVWGRYFRKHTVNLGIGGDKVEDVNREMRYVVLICETNNIENVPADVVKGIKYIIQLIKCKFYNFKVIVSGILSHVFSPGIRKNKIRLVNIQIKYAVAVKSNNNVTYIDPEHTWTTLGGTLNTNLYYKDTLYLIQKGNEKLAKGISTALNVRDLKQQQKLLQIGQQEQQEHPHHQQKHHHQQQQESQQHTEELQKLQKER